MEPSAPTETLPPDDKWTLYAVAVAEPRQDYYLKHFRRIDAGTGWGLSWNWVAMFFTFSWLRHRRMYAHSWVYFFISTPVLLYVSILFSVDPCTADASESRITPQQVLAILILLGYLLPPLFANRLYFRFVTRKIAAARARETDKNALVNLLQKNAGTGGYWGSVLLMVGVVVVPLAALPNYGDYTTRAKISELLLAGAVYKTPTYEFFAANKRLPTKLEEIGGFSGPGGKIKAVILEANGAIRVVAGFAPLEGRSILFIPIQRGESLVWSCRSDDIPNTCLPAECRK